MVEVSVSNVSIVFPTYRREQVLLDSIRSISRQSIRPVEILVVDQSEEHDQATSEQLERMERNAEIRLIRLDKPSIPLAMNVGLLEAKAKIVLFLDDDIAPHDHLVEMHLVAQRESSLVAGMVLQPGQNAVTLRRGEDFCFNSDARARINEFIGCNFSIRRDVALSLGGFDENFVGAAYRFEAEFANRYIRAHGQILYEPRASICHLRVASGGTRAHGHHLRTARPTHAVGAYYELLRTHRPGWLHQLLLRPWRAIRTRHHLRRPWWIPMTLLSEMRGLVLAIRLNFRGPKLLHPSSQCLE